MIQRVYFEIAEGNWKQRLRNDRQLFKDKEHNNNTRLLSYLRDLIESHKQILKLTRSNIGFAPGYSNIAKRCLLCLYEKLLIFMSHYLGELMAKSRNGNKFLLSNYKGND